ncbi:hypothetical protein ASF41_22135 [Methylobacterium sp. Leaf111]|uniref:hypothetical protein n=1 Tax=Methylobacterium sp. Leaf111 TaxID=1736257 RepID=UPI0006F3DCE2|nr:hypothetical protein [Methylobacterium sp. Leaf111]KQP64059.1 hypothetical protein ASF41_22135 [Methylobacterium sp. Leaf111]
MGLFDDVPDAPKAATVPSAAPVRGGLFDDVPDPRPAEPSALSRAASVAGDVVQSAGAGLIKGAAGAVDLPQTLYGLADTGLGMAARGAIRLFGGTPNSDLGVDTRSTSSIPSPSDLPKPGESAIKGLEAVTQPLYKPQTTAGEYAGTLAEFVPGAGKTVAGLVKNALIPAVASETAGQATKGTDLEPWARGGVALAAGAAGALHGRTSTAERLFDKSFGSITPDELGKIQAVVDDGAALRGADGRAIPIDLTWAEAAQQVLGPRRAGDLLRVVEGQGGLADFFGRRAEQIRAAGGGALDRVAPAGPSPTQVGTDVQAAARAGVAGTPEGQAVIRSTQAAGPRVSPERAGQVIQQEMRQVADAREATRTEQAARDYAAARAVPENAGIEGTVTVERPGEPIVTQPAYSRPQFEADAPRPVEPFERPGAVEAEPGPESLARFIARNGGLHLDGDAAAMDLHRFTVPGVGKVARSDGKSLDNFWRERLIEEGYFRPDADGGMARDISSELLRKLQNEQRGVPSYPMDAQGKPRARSKASRGRDEYDAALSTSESRLDEDLTRAGIDPAGVHPDIRSRVVGALMRGEISDPLDAYEHVVNRMEGPLEPYVKSTTVTEEIPSVRFGQVNPQAALDAVDNALRTAKGDVRASLQAARRNLFGPAGRETDMTVEGLHQARERLDEDIRTATDMGDGVKASRLQAARTALDDVLKSVPEMATADARFAANSRPLEPFSGNTPLARVVQRDPRTGRMATPAEQVPGAVQGATAAREFLANATPEARRAFQDREVTRILDEVGGAEGGASATTIRAAMRRNEDLLAQLPEARQRLQRLAVAYQGREAVDRSPLGRIANSPKVSDAIAALFPTKPREGTAQEVATTVQALSRSNPGAARDLVRMHLGTEFAEATQRLQTGPNQAGGAKFAAAIRGNDLQRESIEAAIRALPNGERVNAGFSRFLDILEATGTRQGIGSKTSFNNEALQELRRRGLVGEGGAAIATGGFKLPSRIMNRLDDWQAGKNVDRLAELLTTPEGGQRLAQLATAKPGASTIALLDRLTRITGRGAQAGDRAPSTEGEPLKLTVRPVP